MKTHNILIVEDDKDIRETLQYALELEGYDVQTAANGSDALHFLKKNHSPQLILLDLMMPIMNGWEFLEAIKTESKLSCIPVIVITAAGEAAARTVDVKAFIKKPIELESLLDTVQTLVC
jgi:two-component system chemotaxis response regulator CheY